MKTLIHRFVEFIPEQLEEDVLYISVEYKTAAHNCACGCGSRVVTPITPVDWKLIYDGKTVSISPSIGNWNFPCRSHYWIKYNRVEAVFDWGRRPTADKNESGEKKRKRGLKWRFKRKRRE